MAINWTPETRKLKDLKPYAKNPRVFTEIGMHHLKRSLEEFGQVEPIVINLDNTIIGGHARVKTLKKQGAKECQVSVPDILLTDEQVGRLCIRLNRNNAGLFDHDILANEFEFEDLIGLGFEPRELGISTDLEAPEDLELEAPSAKDKSVTCPQCEHKFIP